LCSFRLTTTAPEACVTSVEFSTKDFCDKTRLAFFLDLITSQADHWAPFTCFIGFDGKRMATS
jgi:hypothetical protein